MGSSLIGRRRELEWLLEALEGARQGRGGVRMLVGEAGIGKTHVARDFAQRAAAAEVAVLWGACLEDDWRPAYAPWIEALDGYLSNSEPLALQQALGVRPKSHKPQLTTAELRSIDRPRGAAMHILGGFSAAPLGPHAAPLERLLPALRAFQSTNGGAGRLAPDEERLRLYVAVTQLLLAIAANAPTVLVLDDLQWADADSLGLLRHVARQTTSSRFLIVGTYREPDSNTAQSSVHSLSALLNREADYQRHLIRGLDEPDVATYLAEAAGQQLPQALVQAVYAETAGHPFYTREVFRHLVEEGKLLKRAGRWSTDFSMRELGIPDGVRQVLERRLSHLDETTSRVLRLASALGGSFDFDVLQAVTEVDDDTLLDCLDAALGAGFLRASTDARYEFSHAIVRHALYDSVALSPDRRARVHRRVAEALERVHAAGVRDFSAELAVQYHSSLSLHLPLPAAERAVGHALTAADRANAAYAYDRAVTLLRVARDLAVSLPPANRASVLSRLALAEAAALALAEARTSAEAALVAMSQAGVDSLDVAGFLGRIARALKQGGADASVWEPLAQRGLAALGDNRPTGESPRDLVWARLTLVVDRFELIPHGSFGATRWVGYDPAAVAIARASGNEEDYAWTLEKVDAATRPETQELLSLARHWQQPTAVLRAYAVAANDLLSRHGAGREVVSCLQELLSAAERYGAIPDQAEALVQLTLAQTQLGNFAAGREMRERAWELLDRLGPNHRLQTWRPWLRYFLAELADLGTPDVDWVGLASEARGWVDHPGVFGSPLAHASAGLAALAYVRANESAQARGLLANLVPLLQRLDPGAYLVHLAVHLAASSAWELNAAEWAQPLHRLACTLVEAGVADPPTGSTALVLGRAAALLGDWPAAQAAFARARSELDASERLPLRGIVDLDEAAALARAGDAQRAAQLADAAHVRFSNLGMPGWAERAHALRERLSATGQDWYGLTRREVDVLRLIANGRTSKAIAVELSISVATVERHITNLYAKIGVRGRAEATAFALQHDLQGFPHAGLY